MFSRGSFEMTVRKLSEISRKTGEISGFYNSNENFITYISMFRKAAFLEIPRNTLVTAKNELHIKFHTDVLKILENFLDNVCR